MDRRNFHTLDGIRGVAALSVVGRHVSILGVNRPESFLAVDMFFILSGFVIGYAYDGKLAGNGFAGRFMRIRLIRLYPLYALGIALGAIATALGVLESAQISLWPALALGLLMLPGPMWRLNYAPLDIPTWTLPLELIGNAVYAVFYRFFTTRGLAVVAAIGAVGLIVLGRANGTLDGGWSLDGLPLGLARLTFSFFAGVLLFRVLGDRRQHRPVAAFGCLLAVLAIMLVPFPPGHRLALELCTVLVVFPAILFVACQCEPGRRGARAFRFLGLTSYAIYTLHRPLGLLSVLAMERMGLQIADHRRLLFVGFLVMMLAVAWLVDRWYDVPVRRVLGQGLNR